MRSLFTLFLLIFLIFNVSAQEVLKHEKILRAIENNINTLQFGLIIPKEEFFIGIYPKQYIVEDLTDEQCGDIKSSSENNLKVIEVLKSRDLLNKLYVDVGNNRYSSINSDNYFSENTVRLFIELQVDFGESDYYQVFIPVYSRREAKDLINAICDIFDYKYCFKKLKRKL